MTIPQKVLEEIRDSAFEVWFDYQDKFGEGAITNILNGKRPIEIFWDEWVFNGLDWYVAVERNYINSILRENGIQPSEWDWSEHSEYVPQNVDVHIDEVINNTRAHIGLAVDDVEYEPLSYGQDEHMANEIDRLCEYFSVNPESLRPYIADKFIDQLDPHPKRDGWEIISAEDLAGMIINATSSGQLVFLLNERVLDKASEIKEYGITLEEGTQLTFHDFWNGSSTTLATLRMPVFLEPGEFDLYNDGGEKYGVQRCCGLADDAWDGIFSVPKGDAK